MLDLIVVYPVEDEHHLTDKEGRILPDAFLVPRGSTAKDLAFKVHTDLGEHFIRAIDARTHRVVGADHQLKDGDIISIIADRTIRIKNNLADMKAAGSSRSRGTPAR
jgi:ribosome-binding ATPase YchF (GTP1/OBG family)